MLQMWELRPGLEGVWQVHKDNLLEGQNQDPGLLIPNQIRFPNLSRVLVSRQQRVGRFM